MKTYAVYAKVCKGAPYADKWEQVTHGLEEFKARVYADIIHNLTGFQTKLVEDGCKCVYPRLTIAYRNAKNNFTEN